MISNLMDFSQMPRVQIRFKNWIFFPDRFHFKLIPVNSFLFKKENFFGKINDILTLFVYNKDNNKISIKSCSCFHF